MQNLTTSGLRTIKCSKQLLRKTVSRRILTLISSSRLSIKTTWSFASGSRSITIFIGTENLMTQLLVVVMDQTLSFTTSLEETRLTQWLSKVQLSQLPLALLGPQLPKLGPRTPQWEEVTQAPPKNEWPAEPPTRSFRPCSSSSLSWRRTTRPWRQRENFTSISCSTLKK